MTQGFDKDYWEAHWREADGHARAEILPNAHLVREIANLVPGTALDAGCGEGAEAIFMAAQGWQVTAADVSGEVLTRASERATGDGAPAERLKWVEADLTSWEPDQQFDLVTTHYAHPAMPQLAFYERVADWVRPGGTLLIVGHLHTAEATEHGSQDGQHDSERKPPEAASVTAASITATLDATRWDVVTAKEPTRTLTDPSGQSVQLLDVVVRATRLSD